MKYVLIDYWTKKYGLNFFVFGEKLCGGTSLYFVKCNIIFKNLSDNFLYFYLQYLHESANNRIGNQKISLSNITFDNYKRTIILNSFTLSVTWNFRAVIQGCHFNFFGPGNPAVIPKARFAEMGEATWSRGECWGLTIWAIVLGRGLKPRLFLKTRWKKIDQLNAEKQTKIIKPNGASHTKFFF